MKILLIHGIGHAESHPNWDLAWQQAITAGLQKYRPGLEPAYVRFDYDDLFDKPVNPVTYAWAVTQLVGAAAGDVISRPRGLFDWATTPIDRWHAGMVARWVVDEKTRTELERRLKKLIDDENPDAIFAHSLGSLVTYDFLDNFVEKSSPAAGRFLITFGSQIGNQFVRAERFGGRIHGVGAKYWFHLFNPRDPVFTAQIKEPIANFEQLITDSQAGHDAVSGNAARPGYLEHPVTRQNVYAVLAAPVERTLVSRQRELTKLTAKPQRRALLVGINDYPDPAAKLDGCVNDVFKVSSVLQETGWRAEDIRVILDERATRAAVLERLEWLLDGAADGQERLFYFSGHGAQLPEYNEAEVVDSMDECLVTHDFAWTKDTCITDDQFCQFYSTLPYQTRFYTFLDCCHSGGMVRAGGGPKIRAVTPPDDIRHRMLRWNAAEQAWQERKFDPINPEFGPQKACERFMGVNQATFKLGRGMTERRQSQQVYQSQKAADKPGPYMPIIFEACTEGRFAYEYRDGVTSYGAFTYLLTQKLRADWQGRRELSLLALRDRMNAGFKALGFDQSCEVEGPEAVRAAKVFPQRPKPARKR